MSKPAFSCKVAVRPLAEQSDAAKDQYAYAYTVTITNTGDTAAQLIARQWWITDNHGQVQEVRGLGVVGHQPLLNPPSSKDQRDWMLSSLELREGLSVREILETLPAELLDLL